MANSAARERRVLMQDAGLPTTSAVSVVAGTLVAFGAVGVLLAIVGAAGNQLGISTDGVSTNEWRNLGIAGAVVATVVLFGAFFFGGYVAGRMSRRAGASNGAAVFALGVVVVGVVVGLTAWDGAASALRDNLASNGVPTDAGTWSGIAIGAVLAGTAATLLGAVLGGMRGEHWHGWVETAAVEARTPEVLDLTKPENQRSVEEERERLREVEALTRRGPHPSPT
jgi:membrane protease YdiL (CAAX protease family)